VHVPWGFWHLCGGGHCKESVLSSIPVLNFPCQIRSIGHCHGVFYRRVLHQRVHHVLKAIYTCLFPACPFVLVSAFLVSRLRGACERWCGYSLLLMPVRVNAAAAVRKGGEWTAWAGFGLGWIGLLGLTVVVLSPMSFLLCKHCGRVLPILLDQKSSRALMQDSTCIQATEERM